MGDFVGYDGASIFSPHPKTVIEDGYFQVGNDGQTIVAYSSSTQPAQLTSLPPNTLLKSVTVSSGGLVTFTLKQYFPRLLFADCVSCIGGGSPAALGMQMVSSTVGDASATNTALPTVVFQAYSSGSTHALTPDMGFYLILILQNASVY